MTLKAGENLSEVTDEVGEHGKIRVVRQQMLAAQGIVLVEPIGRAAAFTARAWHRRRSGLVRDGRGPVRPCRVWWRIVRPV